VTLPRIVLESCRHAFREWPCGDNHKEQYNWSREDIDGIEDDILVKLYEGSMNLNVMMNFCIYQNAQYARDARDARDALFHSRHSRTRIPHRVLATLVGDKLNQNESMRTSVRVLSRRGSPLYKSLGALLMSFILLRPLPLDPINFVVFKFRLSLARFP
jgi:hypothetical protein